MTAGVGAPSRIVRFGPFEVDLRARQLRKNGRRIQLPGLPFQVLAALIEQPGEPVTREELHRRLWPEGTFVDFDNSLNAAVARLRQTLGDSVERPRYIETLPRLGYRFVAPVERTLQQPSSVVDDLNGAPSENSATRAESVVVPNDVTVGTRAWLTRPLVAALVLAVVVVAGLMLAGRQTFHARAVTDSDAALARAGVLMSSGDIKGAKEEIDRAIKLNGENALAYATLAHALNRLSDQSLVERTKPSPSVLAAERAVAIDPKCGNCQGSLGFFLFYHDWEWDRARVHLERAIALRPDTAGIRPSYALFLVATSRIDEALRQIDIALAASPTEAGWHSIRSSILYAARRYPEAIAAADRALALDDKDSGAWQWRSRSLFQLQRGEEAIRALAQVTFRDHAAALERAVTEGGTVGGLRELLVITGDWQARFAQSWRRAPWQALLGNVDETFEELERAFQRRNYNLMYLAVDPVYDSIRTDHRFQALLQNMGLVPTADIVSSR